MSELTDRLRDGVNPPEDSEVADLIDAIDQGLAAHLDLCGYDACEGCRVAEDVRALINPEDES